MIRLEKFDPTCYDKLISWIDSAETLMQFGGPAFIFPLTREQLDKALSDPNSFAFSVVDQNNQEMIGHAEIYLTKNSAYLARIIIGDPQKRGKGLGGEIVSFLLHYAFTVLEQSNVQLNVFEWNLAAIRCYEKAGFHSNPGIKAERVINGKTWRLLNFTIRKQEWESLQ